MASRLSNKLFLWKKSIWVSYFETKKSPTSPNRLGKKLTFRFFEINAELSIVMKFLLQYSLKSAMLKKCKLGVSYH